MGILSRFKDIMASNINAMLDKAEDPEKMIDQYIRNLNEDLAEVKSETAAVMAEERRASRKLDDCDDEIVRMTDYAKRAITAGNDADAKRFLAKKNQLQETQVALTEQYQVAKVNATKMRQMYDKIQDDIEDLNARRDTLKAKLKVAKAKQKINEMGAGYSSAQGSVGAFNKLEDRINNQIDKQEAMAELGESSADRDLDHVMDKYKDQTTDVELDDQLAALKEEMNK